MTNSVSARNLKRLAGSLALLLIAFAGLFGWQEWRSEKAEQIRQMTTALALSQTAVDLYFAQIEASLRFLSKDIVDADGRVQSLEQVNLRLIAFKQLQPQLSAISLVDMEGKILASSVAGAAIRVPSVANVPSFQQLMSELTPDTQTSLGRPMFGEISQRWLTPLQLVLRDAQGRPVASLIASMPVDLLQSFWTAAPITARASMGLLRDDGFLAGRYPVPAGVTPEDVYGRPRSGTLRTHLRTNGYPREGYVEGPNQTAGISAGNVFKRLDSLPLTMFVSMPTSEFSHAWWQRVQVPFGLLALLSLGGWAGYLYTLRRQTAWDTERRDTEAALRASESEQRFLFDHLLAGVVVHDASGRITTVNAHASRLLGMSPETLLARETGVVAWRVLTEDGTPMTPADNPVLRVQQTLEPIADLVVGVPGANGEPPVWLMANIYPEFYKSGGLRQIIVTFVDITARRRVESRLLQSENRYRLLFENSLDAVMQTRPDGAILAANEAACRMFGMTEQEIIRGGRKQLEDPADTSLAKLLAERERTGRVAGELTMRRADGTCFSAELSSSMYIDASGDALASVVLRDVTERRRAEAATQARDLAERANRAKSEFIARMSHELRTPLNAILGFSEVMQIDDRQPLMQVQREQLAHVQRAGNHLLLLINDLLDLSRIESGVLAMQPDDIDLPALVKEALRESAAQAEGCDVRLALAPTHPQTLAVRADPTRVRQIVLNLLSNAIKYNRPGGQVNVRVDAIESGVELSVQDSGIGMSEAQVATLFQPFNRLGREASTTEGTGIGLVITRGLVELMNGSLAVRSEAGVGSEFTVRLPSTRQPGEAGLPAPMTSNGADALEDILGNVLYVDDDAVNQVLMQAFLRLRPGIVLTTTSDGFAGLEAALARVPDLMMIDMMMPGLDGLGTMRAVREAPSLRDVRCVAVSANAMPDEIDAAIAAGFDGYLTKPLSSQRLLAEVDRWISLARRRDDPFTEETRPAGR